MKMKKYLKKQGIHGPSYKLFNGNLKELVMMKMEARSKPMELSHRIVPRLLPFEDQAVKTYGKMYVSWFGSTPRVNIMDPEMIRDILSNKFGHFAKGKRNPFVAMLARGVVSYHGEQWVKHRRIINPAFHQEKLKVMLPAFYACCSELIEKWEKLLVSGESCEVNVWPYLQNLSADVISRSAFGSSYEEGRRIFELQAEQSKLVMEAIRSIYIPGFRFVPTKRNRRMKEIFREVGTLLREMITKREKAMKHGEASADDLLGILMESNLKEVKNGGNAKNLGMSVDEVIEECKLFYFAGQETTSTLLVWTMVALSMHQEWQEKAREEVIRVFGQAKPPDFEGLNRLKVVTMILNEVLRLYPPVIMLVRSTYKTIKLGNIILPPGVELGMPILLVQHDRELWGEDAEEFNPERFSEGVSKVTQPSVEEESSNGSEGPITDMSLPDGPDFSSLKVDIAGLGKMKKKGKMPATLSKKASPSPSSQTSKATTPSPKSPNSKKRHLDVEEPTGSAPRDPSRSKEFRGAFHFGDRRIMETDSALNDPQVAYALVKGSILPADLAAIETLTDGELNRNYYSALARVQMYGCQRATRQNAAAADYKLLKADQISKSAELADLKKANLDLDASLVTAREEISTLKNEVSSKNGELAALTDKFERYIELSKQAVIDKVKSEVARILAEMKANEAEADEEEETEDQTPGDALQPVGEEEETAHHGDDCNEVDV